MIVIIIAIPRSRIVGTSDKNGCIDEVMLDALGTMGLMVGMKA